MGQEGLQPKGDDLEAASKQEDFTLRVGIEPHPMTCDHFKPPDLSHQIVNSSLLRAWEIETKGGWMILAASWLVERSCLLFSAPSSINFLIWRSGIAV